MAELANPTIALGVKPISGPEQAQSTLGLLGGIANVQGEIARSQLEQRSVAARQRAGQILSSAPSMEAGIQALENDPLTAGYAPEIASTIAGINQTLTATAGAKQEQAQSGLVNMLKLMGAGVSDPSLVKPMADAALQAMSPSARAANEKSYGALVSALTDGLPQDPNAALAAFNKRVAAVSLGAGLSPEQIRAQTGTPAPVVTMEPVGPHGEGEPVLLGGPAGGQATANVLGATPTKTGPQSVATPQPPIRTLSPEELQASNAKGAAAGDLAKEMADASGIFPDLKRIDMMQGALGEFQAGGGADVRQSIGRTLQALRNAGFAGITQDQIDKVANSSLSGTQLFNAEVKPVVMGMMRQAIQGTGKAMRPEVDAFMQSMDATTDPATLMKLLNQAKYDLQIEYDKSQKYLQYKQLLASGSPSVKGLEEIDFPEWYAAHFAPKALPTETTGGTPIGPTPVGEAKGAVQAGGGSTQDKLKQIFGF